MYPIFYFDFYKTLNSVNLSRHYRVSTWYEGDETYMVPCQFETSEPFEGHFKIRVILIEPSKFLKKEYVNQKFLFGEPNRIVGYGILEKIEVAHGYVV